MKKLSIFLLIASASAQAGEPLWSLIPVPGFPPSTTVTASSNATVKYTLTNQSRQTHTLTMQPIQGVSASGCESPLGSRQSCTLVLDVDGSKIKGDINGGPVICDQGNTLQCYQPSQANSLAIRLVPVVSLCVTPSTLAAATSGNPREITVTNIGSNPVMGMLIQVSELPSGAMATTTCGSTLAPSTSCTLTLTPGFEATLDSNSNPCTQGGVPVPDTFRILAEGLTTIQGELLILGHGCQYAGGFIFAIDDTTPATQSIAGKVIALVDQAEPFIGSAQPTSLVWSSDGTGPTNYDFTTILGLDELSTTSTPSPSSPAYPAGTPSYLPCEGATDGACDSFNIISYYNYNRTAGGSAPTPLTDYAAGLCVQTINGYSDWFLPAICEMDAVNPYASCPSGAQSVVGSLAFLIGDVGSPNPSTNCGPPTGTQCLTGMYWASTEESPLPQYGAWSAYFNHIGGYQAHTSKSNLFGARCARAF